MPLSPGSLPYKVIKLTGTAVLRGFDFLAARTTANKAVLDSSALEFCNTLKKNWMIFRDEYLSVQKHVTLQNVKDFYKVEYDLKPDENWKSFPLLLFNYRFVENSEQCPKTFEIIREIPGCTSAMFSVLGPGKHIPPHRGIYKGLYRVLLGLMVSDSGKCWIKINGKEVPFREGKCIVFDETAEHEVFNGTDEPRVVLYLDIYRRLPFPINKLNDLVFSLLRNSPFIKNIISNYQKLDAVTYQEFIPRAPAVR